MFVFYFYDFFSIFISDQKIRTNMAEKEMWAAFLCILTSFFCLVKRSIDVVSPLKLIQKLEQSLYRKTPTKDFPYIVHNFKNVSY